MHLPHPHDVISPFSLTPFLFNLSSTAEAAQSGCPNTPVLTGATPAHAALPIFTDTLAEGAGNRALRWDDQSTQPRLGGC